MEYDYYHVAQADLHGNGVQDAACRCDDDSMDDGTCNDNHSNNSMDDNRLWQDNPCTRKQCHLRKNS